MPNDPLLDEVDAILGAKPAASPSLDLRAEARRIAAEENVDPDLFERLITHESGWKPAATSRVGAIGLGQLMPETARELGVDPHDPLDNLRGSARYLRQQLDTFGQPDLALAAYNAGPGAVQRYGGIPPFAETQAYVPAILNGYTGAGAGTGGGPKRDTLLEDVDRILEGYDPPLESLPFEPKQGTPILQRRRNTDIDLPSDRYQPPAAPQFKQTPILERRRAGDIDLPSANYQPPSGPPAWVHKPAPSKTTLTDPGRTGGDPSLLERAGDAAVSFGQGVVGIGEAAVGLLDIPTGGAFGKFVDEHGILPPADQIRAWLEAHKTPTARREKQAFHDAQGIAAKVGELLEQPSIVANAIAESLPLMVAGGGIGRAVAGAGLVGPTLAGAIGEGVVGAGSAAESIRTDQQNPDRTLTPGQSAAAVASGAATSLFGAIGGKIAARFGLDDVDTLMAGARTSPQAARNLGAAIVYGAVSEGLLEELPQSLAEQAAQNLATGRPVTEGMTDAGLMGLVTGGVMGAGGNAARGAVRPRVSTQNTPVPVTDPSYGKTNAAVAPTTLEDAVNRTDSVTPDISGEGPATNADPNLAHAPAEAPTTELPTPAATASVPFMVTRAMQEQLRARGYDQAAIDALTPADAHAILSQPDASTPAELPDETPSSPTSKDPLIAEIDAILGADTIPPANTPQIVSAVSEETRDTAAPEKSRAELLAEKLAARLKAEGHAVNEPDPMDFAGTADEFDALERPTLEDEPEVSSDTAAPERPRRNAINSNALEDALSPQAQANLAGWFKDRTKSRDLRHIREAMEVYQKLLDMGDEGAGQAATVRRFAEEFFLKPTRDTARALQDAAWVGLQTITGEEDPDLAELLENEVFADAKDAGALIFNTLDPKTASFDVEEFNTAYGMVEFRRAPEDVFPAPKRVVNARTQGKPLISQADADALLAQWKAAAKAEGATGKNKNKVIYSLFDVSGVISQPFVDAGYTVRRFDIKNGDDLMDFGSWMEQVEEDIAEGLEVHGVLAQPPCTSFAVSGARWWKDQHDQPNTEMVKQKYGLWAAEYFDTPLDYANSLVAVVKLFVAQSDPKFYAMENPVGRIASENGLPKPTLVFDPNNFGNPYTKQTQLWGEFNPDLPTANVEATLGSYIHKLRGDVAEQKAQRSVTPEGFAYAFFMANHGAAVAQPATDKKPATPQVTEPGTKYVLPSFVTAPHTKKREPVGTISDGPPAPKPAAVWMNEGEIEEAVERFATHPVLGPAARFLEAFKDQVNRNSDGWPYWKQPSQAAGQLMALLHGHLRAGMGAYPKLPEPTAADVQATMAPIKAFMTKRGTKAGIVLPELKLEAPPKKAKPDGPKIDIIESMGAAASRYESGDSVTYEGESYTVAKPPTAGDRLRITRGPGLTREIDARKLDDYLKPKPAADAVVDDDQTDVPWEVADGPTARKLIRAADRSKGRELFVPFDKMVATQPRVSATKAAAKFDGENPPAVAVEYEGKFYLMDGTHRATAAFARGADGITATVWPVVPEWLDNPPGYTSALDSLRSPQTEPAAPAPKPATGTGIVLPELKLDAEPASKEDAARAALAKIRAQGWDIELYDEQDGKWIAEPSSVSDRSRSTGTSRKPTKNVVQALVDTFNANVDEAIGERLINEKPAAPAAPAPDADLDAKKAANEAKRKAIFERLSKRHATQLNAGIDPQDLVDLAELALTYVDDGVTEFRRAWRMFKTDAPHLAGKLGRAFEMAWEEVTGETAFIADADKEADTTDQQESANGDTPGRAGTDAGQLPDSGRGPAGPRGTGSPGPLGAVSPDDGRGAEGEGDAGPRGTEGLAPEGLPAGGPRSQDGPASRPVGGTVPGGTVSVAGAGADPGPRPLDYALTPERIQAIVGRGGMTRARDNIAAMRLAKELHAEKRHATLEEQETLARYVGWGSSELAAFLADSPKHNWKATEKAVWQELRDITTEDERRALAKSTLNAHYTFELYTPIWEALERHGFAGGRILEPAVGTGHAFGTMPAQLRANSTLLASELETLTATIAAKLYPSARVQNSGYEKARIPQGTQDLVISNVPFGSYGVDDQLIPEKLRKPIHNYFFAKALTHVRPGGLIVFVTSRYTMDGAEHTGFRRHMMQHAHFLGAVRLPNTAFDKSAKTEVITDIIVLRRFLPGETEAQNADAFIQSPKVEEWTREVTRGRKRHQSHVYRSAWYALRPSLVLGTESLDGSMYSDFEYTVQAAEGAVLNEQIAAALGQVLPEGAYVPASEAVKVDLPTMVEGEFKPGELRVEGKGTRIVRVKKDGSLIDVTPQKKGAPDAAAVKRIAGLIGVRDARKAVVDAMRTDQPDADIKKAQANLDRVYKRFVKDYGDLNSQTNKRLFKADPDAPNLLALETLEARARETVNKKGEKTIAIQWVKTGLADIFTKRTIHAPKEVTHADTPYDALMASLARSGAIDWRYMARITGRSQQELQQALIDQGRVYLQPDGTSVIADEYLSGDVVAKLADAKAAAETDPDIYTRNITALEQVQPKPKTISDVETGDLQFTLGANWIPREVVTKFVAGQLNGAEPSKMSVTQTEAFVRWEFEWSDRAIRESDSHALAVKYRQERQTYGFIELLQDAINLKTPSLGWWEGSGDDRHYVKDPAGTDAARANVEALRAQFQAWVAEDADLTQRLVDLYNERFNRYVQRQYDGSHLLNVENYDPVTKTGDRTSGLPGMALPFPLFKHQLNAIWRALVGGNTLLAHEVGAGKTFEMIAIAMEMRRTGRARKPMITVPTNLLAQWRADILKAYPTAKLLAFDSKDLDAKSRQVAMSRIANGDWDIVLVPHSSFELLQVNPERMASTLQAWVDELTDAWQQAKNERGENDESVKKIQQAKARIEDKVRKLLDKASKGKDTDTALYWEDMGVDALLVDEAHAFKNLWYWTSVDRMRGLSTTGSDRSLSMWIKVKEINESSNYRNLVFATATPIMNSMVEVYTMQRYLQPQVLEAQGFSNFDNWYRTFAEAVPSTESRPDGTFEEVMRLKNFRNLDLLYKTFSNVMDYIGWADMPYLKLPKLLNDRIEIEETSAHPAYEEVIRPWLAKRLDNIKAFPPHINQFTGKYEAPDRPHPLDEKKVLYGADGKPAVDNILTIMRDAKLAAIDPRLVPGLEGIGDFPGSRLSRVVANVVDIYQAEKKEKGAQIVFLDVGIPANAGTLEFLSGVTVEETEDDAEAGVVGDAEADEVREGSSFDLYTELKRQLVKKGIKSREIAFIHQARNATERLALFEAVNDGRVRVLIASTDKGSVGMNVQQRLAGEHHFDVPRAMRPGDIRQRDGRIIRQGNRYERVRVIRYVTKATTDEWLYGLLSSKSHQSEQFMRGTLTTLTEDDPNTVSIEEAQARASGNPKAVELITLRAQAKRIGAQAIAQERQRSKARADLAQFQPQLATQEGRVETTRKWVAEVWPGEMKGDAFTMTVGDETFTKRSEANDRIIAALRAKVADGTIKGGTDFERFTVATIGGLPIEARPSPSKWDWKVQLLFPNVAGGSAWITDLDIPRADADGKTALMGEGRNVVQSITDRYNNFAHLAMPAESFLTKLQEDVDRAKKVLARPTDAIERYQNLTARVDLLERELKADTAALEAQRKADAEQRMAAEKARKDAAANQDGGDSGGSSAASFGTFTPTRTGLPATLPGVAALQRTVTRLRGLEVPELVELATELLRTPRVVEGFRGKAKNGLFRGWGGIELHADLFKRGNERQLAATLAHEIGHLIDWLPNHDLKRGNLLGRLLTLQSFLKHTFTMPGGSQVKNAEVKEELVKLSAMWRPWDPDTATASFAAYRNSSRELYADALSVLLNDPALLEREAPVFYRTFFEALDEKPAVRDAYAAMQVIMAATPEERIDRRIARDREMFERGDQLAIEAARKQDAEDAEDRKRVWGGLRAELIDKHAPFQQRVKEALERGARINEDEDPRYLLNERNYLGAKIKGFIEKYFEPVKASVLEAGIDWHEFGQLLHYERINSGDAIQKANAGGIGPKEASENHTRIMRKLTPAQRDVANAQMDAFRGAMRAITDEAYDAGLFTPELYKQMVANPAYVTNRVLDHIEEQMSSRVFKRVGSLKDIQNVADATILKMIVTLKAAEHNRVKLGAFQFLERQFRDEIQQADETWNGRGYTPRESKDKRLHLVTYMDQGKLRGKYVAQEIADSLNNEAIGRALATVRALQLANTRWFRPVFTTFNLGFQMANFARDFYRFWKAMPNMSLARAVRRYKEAMPVAWARTFGDKDSRGYQDLVDAEEAGILGVTFNDMLDGRDHADTQIEDIFRQVGIPGYQQTTTGNPLRKLLRGVELAGNFIETLPKAAAVHEFKGDGDISDIGPAARDFIRRRVGSPDFLAGGTLKPFTNELFLFSNAITQAMRADVETAFRDPQTRSGFWWKTAALNLVPKALTFGALFLAAGGGDDDDEGVLAWARNALKGASEYDLTNYLVIPLGTDARGNSVYFRMPQDDAGRMIGGLFWKALGLARGDKDTMGAVAQLVGYVSGQTPSLTPIFGAVGDTVKYASGRNIYDDYRNRMLFTEEELAAGGTKQFGKFLGYEFQELGGGIVWKFYAGEDRPRQKGTGQWILELPVASSTAGRFIKVSSYGQTERLRQSVARQAQLEAGGRQTEREAVNQALREVVASGDRSLGALNQKAIRIVQDVYRDASLEDKQEKRREVLARLQTGAKRGEADPLTDAVLGARSNQQKVAAIVSGTSEMSATERREWLKDAVNYRVISPQVRDKVLQEMR
jgi:N12 class adenine-specific DNA methylase